MIDVHSHILPGIDDGPATVAESLAMAREYVARGVGTVVATPHVGWDAPNEPIAIAAAVEDLTARLAAQDIPLIVLPGAEVALSRAVELEAEELAALCLADGPWLLLEPPLAFDGPGVEGMVGIVQARVGSVLVAHPERCTCFHRDPDLLARLVDGGALAQVTTTSLSGAFGRTVQRVARDFVARGLVHVASADAHDALERAPGLREPLDNENLGALVDWMTKDVPAAIVAGRDIPARPPARRGRQPSQRRGWFGGSRIRRATSGREAQ